MAPFFLGWYLIMNYKKENELRVEREEILELLPHRGTFQLIDALENLNGEDSCTGIFKVTEDAFWVPDHFPSHPVLPGVLIIEAIAQTAGALVAHYRKDEINASVIYFLGIDKVKFRKPVFPGSEVRIDVNLIHRRGAVWKYSGVAKVDGEVATQAEVSAMNYEPKE